LNIEKKSKVIFGKRYKDKPKHTKKIEGRIRAKWKDDEKKAVITSKCSIKNVLT